MLKRYMAIINNKGARESVIIAIICITLGIVGELREFGVSAWFEYQENEKSYQVLEGTIVNIEKYYKSRYTIVYCDKTDEYYNLPCRRKDVINEKVVFAHRDDTELFVNIWLNPYVPKDVIRSGGILLFMGILAAVGVVRDIKQLHKTKIIYATVLYKKIVSHRKVSEEYAVCLYRDENGKEYLAKTRCKIYPMNVQVKDELLVAVNPRNYKSYWFLEEDEEYIKRGSEEQLDAIAQNLDKYLLL